MTRAGVTVRTGGPEDAATVHRFICALAEYEREPDAVEATPESLEAQLSAAPPPFDVLIAELGGEPVGFALSFPNFSTWTGQTGTHLEDLFVLPEARGSGAGRALVAELARRTEERGGARLDWQVLDWNTPAIGFYESLAADIKRDWLPCRLDGDGLAVLAREAGGRENA